MKSIAEILKQAAESEDPQNQTSSINEDVEESELTKIIDRQVALFNNSKGSGSCIDCNGKGLIATREGNYQITHYCNCKIKKDAAELMRKNGFGKMSELTLDDYHVEYDWQKVVKKAALDFVNEENPVGFLITGQPGCGKTLLLSCLANELYLKTSIAPLYISFTSWLSSLKDVLGSGKLIYDEINKLKYAPILLLDDVLKSSTLGRVTPFDLETLFQIIDYRYKTDSLITLISSELLPDSLYQVDKAIAGRIIQMSSKFNIQIKENKKYDFRLPTED